MQPAATYLPETLYGGCQFPPLSLAAKITRFYMHKIMPVIGGLISGSRDAYIYLPDSIDSFITTKEMIKELKDVGLEPIFVKGYSLDMSTTFIARKI